MPPTEGKERTSSNAGVSDSPGGLDNLTVASIDDASTGKADTAPEIELTETKLLPDSNALSANAQGKGAADNAPSAPTPGPPVVLMVLTKKELALTFSGLMLGMLLATLDSTIVSTALPSIAGEFGQFDLLPWVISAYLISSTALTPVYGRVSDAMGRKHVIPPRDRGKYQGITSGTFAVSSVAGPLLGGFFTDTIGWRWVFYINLPLGALALIVVAIGLKSTPIQKKEIKLDFVGIPIVIVAVITLLLPLSWGGVNYAWSNGIIISLFIISGLAFILFIWVELRWAKWPLVPVRLLPIRNVWVAMVGGTIIGLSLLCITTYMPLYFQIVRGITPTMSGINLLPVLGGVVISSFIAGTVTARTGKFRWNPVVGSVCLTTAFGLFALFAPDTGLAEQVLILLLAGLGIGVTLPTYSVAAQNAVALPDIASITTSWAFFRTVGGVVGITIFQALVANELDARLHIPGVDAGTLAPEEISFLPAATQAMYIAAYAASLQRVWLYLLAPVALAIPVSLFLKHQELRGSKPKTPAVKLPGAEEKAPMAKESFQSSLKQAEEGAAGQAEEKDSERKKGKEKEEGQADNVVESEEEHELAEAQAAEALMEF